VIDDESYKESFKASFIYIGVYVLNLLQYYFFKVIGANLTYDLLV